MPGLRVMLLSLLILLTSVAGRQVTADSTADKGVADSLKRSAATKTAEAAIESNAQQAEHEPYDLWGIPLKLWGSLATLLVFVLGLLFATRLGYLQEKGRKLVDEKQSLQRLATARQKYHSIIRSNLGTIRFLGFEDYSQKKDLPVDVEDAYVSLSVSLHRDTEIPKPFGEPEQQRQMKPVGVIALAVSRCDRLVVILGGPGSGKTTVVKHLALSAMHKRHCRNLGYPKPLLPLYLPLREFSSGGTPSAEALLENIAAWARKKNPALTRQHLEDWLNNEPTLVLLDGLDELSNTADRQAVCNSVDQFLSGYDKARVVLTSRDASYGKQHQVNLEFPEKLEAFVRDLSGEQQEHYLNNWFYAVERKNRYGGNRNVPRRREKEMRARGREEAAPVIAYLQETPEIRRLVRVPVLLQILSVIWKNQGHKPESRSGLYRSALGYLMYDRDKARGIPMPLLKEDLFRVIGALALYLQEELRDVEVEKEDFREVLQRELDKVPYTTDLQQVFERIRERSALFQDLDDGKRLIFIHKSFMEYLAGMEIRREELSDERFRELAAFLPDTWWPETLKFFMNASEEHIFRKFFAAVINSDFIAGLHRGSAGHELLLQLIHEAPRRAIRPFADPLKAGVDEQLAVVLIDALQAVDREEGYELLATLLQEQSYPEVVLRRCREVLSQSGRVFAGVVMEQGILRGGAAQGDASLITNRYELNAEYLCIPGGSFRYSVSESEETVPQRWLARYPLSNRLYRRFIRYLEGGEVELQERLPRAQFAEQLSQFADTIEGFRDYLPPDSAEWPQKMRSQSEDDRRFNDDEQPVVDISWYAARSYCFWQSLLTLEPGQRSVERAAELYRLPLEVEWEWAAAGRAPGGGLREYPWPAERGKPSEKLANYGSNVGQTTPVGSYADGATPEGLLDMAGNIWEWMEDYPEKGNNRRSLRGGSWSSAAYYLRCSARSYYNPELHSSNVGFRILLSRS